MIYAGDCLFVLPTLEANSVQCCVTSPPYWGLRDYGCAGQLGLEKTPEEYVEKLVAVFREVRRVLRDDGVLWLNLGDSYAGGGGFSPNAPSNLAGSKQTTQGGAKRGGVPCASGLKPKDLVGIPWRVAFALQADGWWLRQDIIWAKPNPMPESVTDRCTKAHEYIFLLTKNARYFYDAEAVKEPAISEDYKKGRDFIDRGDDARGRKLRCGNGESGRNRRSVWTITTKPFKEAHFATFPPEIPEICIKAGSKPGDTILDPFSGAGTTGVVAEKLGRKYIGIELNTAYCAMSERRIDAVQPLFAGMLENGG